MKVAIFSTKPYDRQFLESANRDYGHDLSFLEPRLNHDTSTLAAGFPAVCVFVNDQLDASMLTELAQEGTRLIALRCAGFNNVDLTAAQELGLTVVRVPAYSPYAVAEHTVALILRSIAKFIAPLTACAKATLPSMDCSAPICTAKRSESSGPVKSASLWRKS